MASLFKAVRNFFREKKDNAAEAMSDTVRDAKYDIQDSKTKVKEFERKVAQLMSTNNMARRNLDGAKGQIKKWGDLAKKAAQAGNEADVTSAIQKKQSSNDEAKAYSGEIKRNDKIIADLRSQLNKARAKIAKAESNSSQLAARLEGAKVRKELASASSGFGDGPLAALDNLEKAVDTAECEADAYEDLHSDGDDDLEEKYGSSDAGVDDEVAKLMAAAKS